MSWQSVVILVASILGSVVLLGIVAWFLVFRMILRKFKGM